MRDFTGFSFDNVHSSEMGIIRVSEGSNYEEQLLPEFEDLTTDVSGIDGQYYFGSQYKPKNIKISIAFDSMTEIQLRRLRRWLSVRKLCPLIFDERPYKQYMAKIDSVPELSYVCFDERRKYAGAEQEGIRVISRENGEITRERITPWVYDRDEDGFVYERIYKGTGSIEFICYSPFAKAQFKILDLYGDYKIKKDIIAGSEDSVYYTNNPRPEKDIEGRWIVSNDDITDPTQLYIDYGNPFSIYTNINEWGKSSGIMPYSIYAEENIDKVIEAVNNPPYTYIIPVYNPGDVDAPFELFIPYSANSDESYGTISSSSGDQIIINCGDYKNTLILKPIVARKQYQYENGIIINTRNHLIEGVRYNVEEGKAETTGELYNDFIIGGDFGTIIRSEFYPFNNLNQAVYTNLNQNNKDMIIRYSYLYY